MSAMPTTQLLTMWNPSLKLIRSERSTVMEASRCTSEASMTTGSWFASQLPLLVYRKHASSETSPTCKEIAFDCDNRANYIHRVFQLMVILSEISNALSNDETLGHKTVNLRASQAVADIQAFIPGVSASILAFVVFGTTKTFRDYFYRKFVPRRIRRARALKRRAKGLSTIEIQPRPARRARPTDSTMYPPAPRRTSTTVAVPYYQPPSPGARVECFELDGGDGGFGKHKTMSTHELAVPTPTYSTFELQKQGDDEDRMPILKIKPTG